MSKGNICYKMIRALVFLMPLHTFIFNLFGTNEILVLWRDAMAILIFIYAVFAIGRGKIKFDTTAKLLLISWVFGLVHAVLFHDRSMSVSIWLNTYRVYFIPSSIYFIIINSDLKRREICSLKIMYIYEIFAICVFGIIQQFLIGSKFTDFMGYRRASITFATGIQRNIGLFDSANIMAVFLLFAIILCLEEEKKHKSKLLIVVFIVLVAGLIFTFSFSSYIAFSVVLIAQAIFNCNNINGAIMKMIKGVVVAGFVIAAILLADKYLLNSLIYEQIEIRVVDLFIALNSDNLTSLTTSSAADHLLSIIQPIEVLKENFWGVGFSVGTFMVLGKVSVLKYAVESSVFTILYDFGIISGIVYLIPFCSIFFLKRTKSKIFMTSKLLGVALLTVFITLPLVQSYELRFFFFLFYALAQREYFLSNVKGECT